MNNKLKKIKEDLIKRRDELEIELKRLGQEKTANTSPDPADQASASTMEELNISLQNNDREEYLRITKALKMIEDGTYGICMDCEKPISEKRLKLYPNTTRCIACQEAAERQMEE